MESIRVKDLMVPLAEYATVSEDATLYEAVMALEDATKGMVEDRDRHRAILVIDRKGRVVGQVGQWDVLWGLEPRYKNIGELRETSRYGFSPQFLRSMLGNYGLWRKPLDDLCRKAARDKVKDFMVQPGEGEFVEEDATMDTAIHLLVMGRHQSLLVTRNESIVGILRQSDVFKVVCDHIKACRI